jgi:hypothetical protein
LAKKLKTKSSSRSDKELQKKLRHERYVRDKDKELAQAKIWRANNAERYKEIQRRWFKENAAYWREYLRAYRKKKGKK